MSWLDFANHFLSNQRLHAWSWINRTFSGIAFLEGNLALSVWAFFLFCFCLVRGEKVASAHDFGWKSKGNDHFGSWFPFFPCLLVTILYCSDIVWSKDLSIYFFCFLPIFDQKFFFLLLSCNLWLGIFFFCFLLIFDRKLSFSFFVFFRGQGWTFSPWVKVYGDLGFWLKACRTAGHGICQGVGLASGSGIKGMSHIYFHDTHTTMMIWKFYAKLVMHVPMWTLKHQVFMVMWH